MPRLYSTRDECGTLTIWNQQVYKQSARRNTCPTAPLSATNPTWADVRLKLCLCSAMPATNCLSCCTDRGGTIIWDMLHYMVFISGRIIRTPRSCSSHWIHKQFVSFFIGRTQHSSQMPHMDGIHILQQWAISSQVRGISSRKTHPIHIIWWIPHHQLPMLENLYLQQWFLCPYLSQITPVKCNAKSMSQTWMKLAHDQSRSARIHTTSNSKWIYFNHFKALQHFLVKEAAWRTISCEF